MDQLFQQFLKLINMRMLFFFIIPFFLFTSSCDNRELNRENSRECAIIEGNNLLLRGVPNIVRVKSNNVSSNDIVLKIYDEIIEPIEDFTFVINTDRKVTIKVELVDIRSNNILASKVFKVKNLPSPELSLSYVKGNKKRISKNELSIQKGVRSEILNWDYDLVIPIEGFSILDTRGRRELTSPDSNFTLEQSEFLKNIKSGEYLIIVNAKAKMPYKEVTILSPIIYEIF